MLPSTIRVNNMVLYTATAVFIVHCISCDNHLIAISAFCVWVGHSVRKNKHESFGRFNVLILWIYVESLWITLQSNHNDHCANNKIKKSTLLKVNYQNCDLENSVLPNPRTILSFLFILLVPYILYSLKNLITLSYLK